MKSLLPPRKALQASLDAHLNINSNFMEDTKDHILFKSGDVFHQFSKNYTPSNVELEKYKKLNNKLVIPYKLNTLKTKNIAFLSSPYLSGSFFIRPQLNLDINNLELLFCELKASNTPIEIVNIKSLAKEAFSELVKLKKVIRYQDFYYIKSFFQKISIQSLQEKEEAQFLAHPMLHLRQICIRDNTIEKVLFNNEIRTLPLSYTTRFLFTQLQNALFEDKKIWNNLVAQSKIDETIFIQKIMVSFFQTSLKLLSSYLDADYKPGIYLFGESIEESAKLLKKFNLI